MLPHRPRPPPARPARPAKTLWLAHAHALLALLLALLLACTLPRLVTADCCLAVSATADPNAPQSYVLRAQGKSSSFFINNKVFEIKALFPNNYATRGAPTALFPLSSANCTQSVAPPDNNPNLFTCFYSSTNPTNPTSFGLQWVLVVPPPGPGQQVKPPDFVSLSVNGDDVCTRANEIDACPEPPAPGSSNATNGGGSSLTMSTIISLGPFGQLPFWLLLVVCAVILLMFAGFFYTCWRNHRGNPEERRRRASMAMASRSPSASAPTLPKDDGSNPQDANWWRRHAATQKRTDSGATLPAATSHSDPTPAPPAPTADAAIPLAHSRSRSSNHTPNPIPAASASNPKPTLITIPDDHSSDSDKPILVAHMSKPRHGHPPHHLMNDPVPPALEPPTLVSATSPPTSATAAHMHKNKSPHLNPVLTSKGELEIPTTMGRRRSYRRGAAANTNTSESTPPNLATRASPATRAAPAPATLLAPAAAPPTSLSRSPSNSHTHTRRAPPTSAAAVAAALTHRAGAAAGAGAGHEVSSATTGSDEYEDPSNLAAMGIRPNSPEKNDRIRNWAGAIAAVKEEDPADGGAGNAAARDVVSESEEEPIGLTLGRAGSGSASFNRQRVIAQQRRHEGAHESESDEEAPLALSMARPRAPAGQPHMHPHRVDEAEDSDEEVPLAATVARGNSGKQQHIRPRAPLQIQGQGHQQKARDGGVDDVIDSYLK